MKQQLEVTKANTADEFLPSITPFSPERNRRLDAIVRNQDLDSGMRFDALVLRLSKGNHNPFACDRVPKSEKTAKPETPIDRILIKPQVQKDFARILKLSKQTISALVKERQDEGLLATPEMLPTLMRQARADGLLRPQSEGEFLANPGWIWPLNDPVAVRRKGEDKAKPPEPELLAMRRNKRFLSEWREKNPDVAKQEDEHRAALDRITDLKLDTFKAWKVDRAMDAKSVHAMPDPPRGQSPARRGRLVHDGMDQPSIASPTSKTHNSPASNDLDSRAGGQTLNLKEEELSIENHPSVGRSSSLTEQPTTTTTTEAAEPSRDDVVVIEKNLGVTKKAARKFLADCRQQSPESSIADIVAVIDGTRPTVDSKRYSNVTGVLLGAVPAKLEAYRKSRTVEATQQPSPQKQAEIERNQAELILGNPDKYVAEDIEWARGVLDKQAKGAGS